MFYYTYVLIDKHSQFYIGYTSNLRKRIEEHIQGEVNSTKYKLPVVLVYYEGCIDRYDAIKREKYLKSGPGRNFLKKRIRIFLSSRGPVNTLVR